MTIRNTLLAAAPLIMLAGCGASGDGDAALSSVEMTQTAQFDAIRAGDLGGAVRYYADDAVMITPDGARREGAEPIVAMYDAMLQDANLAVEMDKGPAWAAESGDLAVTSFTANLTMTDPDTGEAETTPFRNQTVWRREPGGRWMIVSDISHNIPEEHAEQLAIGD